MKLNTSFRYAYSEKEMKEILDSLVIVIDTREKSNDSIIEYFKAKKIDFEFKTMSTGDYSCYVPKNEALGIYRAIHLNSYIERKAGVDEITGNLQKATQQRFINELIRSQGSRFVIFVEEPDFDEKIATGNYISKYDPKALKGRIESLKAKYNFEIVPMSKNMIGHNIYYRFYYQARECLKNGEF